MVMSQEPSERDQRDGQKQGDNVFLLFQTYRKVTSLTEERKWPDFEEKWKIIGKTYMKHET